MPVDKEKDSIEVGAAPVPVVEPYIDFRDAARAILTDLYQALPLGLWMLTRTEGDDWIVVAAIDHKYGVTEDDVFKWSDSFCCRMVDGLGPNIAPRADAVPIYRRAPIASQLDIGTYVGFPIGDLDGKLFGTVCGIDPEPHDEEILQQRNYFEKHVRLLGTLLHNEIRLQRFSRATETNDTPGLDPETGLPNARVWKGYLGRENERSRIVQSPGGIVIARIENSNGSLSAEELAHCGGILRTLSAPNRFVARLAGDLFGILLTDSIPDIVNEAARELGDALEAAGIRHSIGTGNRNARLDFETAQHCAVTRADTMGGAKRG